MIVARTLIRVALLAASIAGLITLGSARTGSNRAVMADIPGPSRYRPSLTIK